MSVLVQNNIFLHNIAMNDIMHSHNDFITYTFVVGSLEILPKSWEGKKDIWKTEKSVSQPESCN